MSSGADQPNGDEIRWRRKNLGLSQEKLAEITGLSKKTIEQAEAGVPKFGDSLRRIATALGCNVPDITNSNPEGELPPDGLQQYICSFDSLIQDLTIRDVPRTYIKTQLDAFLANAPSGYFIIKGDPGMGKSTVMAQLVKERNYIHHFNISADLRNSPQTFANSLCAQIMRTYGLSPTGILPSGSRPFADLLQSVLKQAQSHRDFPKKLVILVDALDEANWKPIGSENVLDLPVTLPVGVYIVATTRQLHALDQRSRLVVRPFEQLVLSKDSAWQQADAKAYINQYMKMTGVVQWMKVNKLRQVDFISRLLEKSEANFMYLRHVLSAMSHTTEMGSQFSSSLTVDELPQGLLEYYARHWYIMQTQDPVAYEKLYKPILCVLGAVSEAVTTEILQHVTGLDLDSIELVLQRWHEFLQVHKRPASEHYYRLYSHSFREFLQSEIDPGFKRYQLLIAEAGARHLEQFD